MDDTIQVLIVEDDFHVANINRDYVLQVKRFDVMHVAKTAEETLRYLEKSAVLPDLILLDVYLPDDVELSLFWTLRRQYANVDIVMITASNEVETIKETFHGGIFDYLVKPADFTRFEETLNRYKEQFDIFHTVQELDQAAIDGLKGMGTDSKLEGKVQPPKGIDEITLRKIVGVLEKGSNEGATAVSIGEQIGVSRSTARRYLEYLVSIKEAKAQLKYGEIGRPERRYTP